MKQSEIVEKLLKDLGWYEHDGTNLAIVNWLIDNGYRFTKCE